MVAGFTLGSISTNIATAVVRGVKKSSTDVIVPISNLGESVSVNDARSMAKFQVEKPARMPRGSRLDDVRVGNNGELVTLLYVNPTVPTISMYASAVGFAILEMVDPKLEYPTNLSTEWVQASQSQPEQWLRKGIQWRRIRQQRRTWPASMVAGRSTLRDARESSHRTTQTDSGIDGANLTVIRNITRVLVLLLLALMAMGFSTLSGYATGIASHSGSMRIITGQTIGEDSRVENIHRDR